MSASVEHVLLYRESCITRHPVSRHTPLSCKGSLILPPTSDIILLQDLSLVQEIQETLQTHRPKNQRQTPARHSKNHGAAQGDRAFHVLLFPSREFSRHPPAVPHVVEWTTARASPRLILARRLPLSMTTVRILGAAAADRHPRPSPPPRRPVVLDFSVSVPLPFSLSLSFIGASLIRTPPHSPWPPRHPPPQPASRPAAVWHKRPSVCLFIRP